MLSYNFMGSVETQADRQTLYHIFQCTTLNYLVTCSLWQLSMQIDSICDGGVATIKGYEDLKSVLLLRECGMYRLMKIPRPLPKLCTTPINVILQAVYNYVSHYRNI